MNTPLPESTTCGLPTADELAGIVVCKDEDSMRLPSVGKVEGVARGSSREHSLSSGPMTDQLAGIPVAADGKEDLTIRARKLMKKQ